MSETNGQPRTDAAEPQQPSPHGEPAPGEARQETAADAERQRLEAELAASRQRVDQLARAYQELNRDREEFKQRLTRERERMLDVERGNVATTLLEAIDDLDRCLAASAQDTSPLAQGVRMIRDGLLAKVTASGIERIQVVGQPYDPNTAEAADMEITTQPEEDQRVVAELRAGYRLKERIIRPARVKVAKYVPPAQA
jgi:molecular chaperone GrpE